MAFDPVEHLKQLGVPVIEHHTPGSFGYYDPDTHVVHVDTDLSDAEKRSTLAHEAWHATWRETRQPTAWAEWRQEHTADLEGARRLIPTDDVVVAVGESATLEDAAEALHVDVPTLTARLQAMGPEERALAELAHRAHPVPAQPDTRGPAHRKRAGSRKRRRGSRRHGRPASVTDLATVAAVAVVLIGITVMAEDHDPAPGRPPPPVTAPTPTATLTPVAEPEEDPCLDAASAGCGSSRPDVGKPDTRHPTGTPGPRRTRSAPKPTRDSGSTPKSRQSSPDSGSTPPPAGRSPSPTTPPTTAPSANSPNAPAKGTNDSPASTSTPTSAGTASPTSDPPPSTGGSLNSDANIPAPTSPPRHTDSSTPSTPSPSVRSSPEGIHVRLKVGDARITLNVTSPHSTK